MGKIELVYAKTWRAASAFGIDGESWQRALARSKRGVRGRRTWRRAKVFGFAPARIGNGGKEPMTVAEWTPSVDIIEDEKEWIVKTDLPEVKKEDVKVTVENGVLTITGERKFEKEEKNKKYHRLERSYGNFLRSFTLPDGADGSKVSAEFKDGLLKVHLPRSPTAKPKAVEIKVV